MKTPLYTTKGYTEYNNILLQTKDSMYRSIEHYSAYVYRITHIPSRMHYYGVRVTPYKYSNDLYEDLIQYRSSSTNEAWKERQIAFPHEFKYKIIKTFNNEFSAYLYEALLHQKIIVNKENFNSFINRSYERFVSIDYYKKVLYLLNNNVIFYSNNYEEVYVNWNNRMSICQKYDLNLSSLTKVLINSFDPSYSGGNVNNTLYLTKELVEYFNKELTFVDYKGITKVCNMRNIKEILEEYDFRADELFSVYSFIRQTENVRGEILKSYKGIIFTNEYWYKYYTEEFKVYKYENAVDKHPKCAVVTRQNASEILGPDVLYELLGTKMSRRGWSLDKNNVPPYQNIQDRTPTKIIENGIEYIKVYLYDIKIISALYTYNDLKNICTRLGSKHHSSLWCGTRNTVKGIYLYEEDIVRDYTTIRLYFKDKNNKLHYTDIFYKDCVNIVGSSFARIISGDRHSKNGYSLNPKYADIPKEYNTPDINITDNILLYSYCEDDKSKIVEFDFTIEYIMKNTKYSLYIIKKNKSLTIGNKIFYKDKLQAEDEYKLITLWYKKNNILCSRTEFNKDWSSICGNNYKKLYNGERNAAMGYALLPKFSSEVVEKTIAKNIVEGNQIKYLVYKNTNNTISGIEEIYITKSQLVNMFGTDKASDLLNSSSITKCIENYSISREYFIKRLSPL